MTVTFLADGGPSTDTAVILINFQNELVRADGALHKRVHDLMEETGMLQKVPNVVLAARKSGALVIHSP